LVVVRDDEGFAWRLRPPQDLLLELLTAEALEAASEVQVMGNGRLDF
jgi:hypothetical protein